MNKLKQKIVNLFNNIKEQINNQITSYKELKFIRHNKESKTKTVFATITYITSMVVLLPSIIHIVFDSVIHLTTGSLSIAFYQLSIYIQG